MTDVVFSMTADEKDVVRGLQAVSKEQFKLRAEIGNLVSASNAAGANDSALAQKRLASLDAILNKQKASKASIVELDAQLKAGTITADQYKTAFEGIGKETNDLTAAMNKLRAQINEDTADFKHAALIIEKNEDKTEKLARAVLRLNRLKEKGAIDSKQYTQAIAAEHAKLTESTDATNAATGRFSGSLGALATGGVAATAFIAKLATGLNELRAEMSGTVQDFDKASRKLGIQGGLSDKERMEQSRMVGRVAFDAAVPIDKAFETATQLNSSGFADPIKGGSLNTALALMQSSNQIDGDAASFIKGSGQFMTAFGMKKDQAGLANLGVRMQGLFKSTDVQAADLPEFAKAAPVLAGANLNLEESLSLLTALRETMNAGEAATGARNVVSLLQTSGANSSAQKALSSIGLRPDQVDIQGEGITAALNTLKRATANLGEAERAEVLSGIFGRENVSPASILMNSTDKLAGFGKMQRDAAATFNTDVQTARTGSFAEKTRSEVSGQMDSVAHEEAVARNELARLARISLRDRQTKANWEKGGLKGRFDAGISTIYGPIDDNFVRPAIGENLNLGLGHLQEQDRLAGRDALGGINRVNVTLPPELTAAMQANQKALERIAAQGEQKQHAGIIAGRARHREEGL